jgi:predicted DNA-binding transcriptional regulator YafY
LKETPIDNIHDMANINKHARSVISFIDALLQTGWHTYDEIIHKIEKSDNVEAQKLSIRTIQNHFNKIRELSCKKRMIEEKFGEYYDEPSATYSIIECRKRGKKNEYKYVDGFKLNDIRLGERITINLLPFIDYLKQVQGIDESFSGIVEVIEDIITNEGIDIPETKNVIRVDNKVIYTYNTGIQAVNDFTPNCRTAILSKQNIKLTYESFSDTIDELIISPYMIVEYNNRWSIIAKLVNAKNKKSIFYEKSRVGKINNFAFDRVTNLEIDKESEYINDNTNINKILDNSIGTSVGDWEKGLSNQKEIVLKFSDRLYPYFVTKPLHEQQDKDDEKKTITYNIIPTIELENVILSYGEGIKVLEPETLKTRIKERLEEALNQYK